MSAAPNTTTSSDFASRWSLMITWGLLAKAKKPFSRHRRCQSRCQTAQMAPASGVITLHITNIRSEAVETRPRAKANVPQILRNPRKVVFAAVERNILRFLYKVQNPCERGTALPPSGQGVR